MGECEFQSALYRNVREMCLAIAEEWLSYSGLNDRDEIQKALTSSSDAYLADQCINMWRLDKSDDDISTFDDATTWMQRRGATRDDLIESFADIRANFDEHFPVDD